MAGLPKKYAKFGFKKGWAMYKRRGGGISGTRKRKSSRRHSRRSIFLSGDMMSPAIIQRPIKNLSSITPKRIASPLIDLGLIIVGMALGAGIKKASPVKNPHLMNGAQAVIGVGGSLMTKNRFIKMPLLGVALQSTIAEAKMLFPKMIPLAGDDEVFYLPVDEAGAPQIQVGADDDRFAGVVDGEEIVYDAEMSGVVDGDDDRLSGVVDGDDSDGSLEGEGGSDL